MLKSFSTGISTLQNYNKSESKAAGKLPHAEMTEDI